MIRKGCIYNKICLSIEKDQSWSLLGKGYTTPITLIFTYIIIDRILNYIYFE